MKCLICNSSETDEVYAYYDDADKYEKWMGITELYRTWDRCMTCGFYQHNRSYPILDLEKIYIDGYRHPDFRGETIEQTYHKIMSLPADDQENNHRRKWFLDHVKAESILDIGSGLGIWPNSLKQKDKAVWCVEKNVHSQKFLTEELDLKCTDFIPRIKFDAVSLIHVLEHIEKPDEFLQDLKTNLHPHSKLFIEVPDAFEFQVLPKDHDEFNSCHLWFFDMVSLYKLLDRNGYRIANVYMPHYRKRDLHRIQVLCEHI